MKNNKGLTLIELVVTVAIIAIFSGVVLTLITNSSNSFRSTSNTAKAQMETQEILDKLQDSVIDVNRSIYYCYGTIEDGSEVRIDNDIDSFNSDVSSARTIYVCNVSNNDSGKQERSYDIVKWLPAENELRYSHTAPVPESGSSEPETISGTRSASEGGVSMFSDEAEGTVPDEGSVVKPQNVKAEESVLASNVTDFRVDLTKVEQERVVRFKVTVNQKGKEITTLHTVNLRNKIAVARPLDNIAGMDKEGISVRIYKAPLTIEAGNTGILSAIGKGDLQAGYYWTVEAPEGKEVTITPKAYDRDAELTAKEGGFTVKVTVTVYGVNGESASDSVDVEIVENKKLESLVISGLEYIAARKDGNTFDLGSLAVKAKIGNDSEDYGDKVNWVCEENAYVSVKENNLIVSKEAWNSEAAPGTFNLYAVSKENPEIISNKLRVQIVRLRILQPKNDSVFNKNETIGANVEFYVGNDLSDNYKWKLHNEVHEVSNEKLVGDKAGEYTLQAEGTVSDIKVSDEVNIRVKGEYTLQGANYLTDTLVKSNLITNQNPYVSGHSDEELARMYWVEDDQGAYVSQVYWDMIREGTILHLSARTMDGNILYKDIHIVSIEIVYPDSRYLEAQTQYMCWAKLSYPEVITNNFNWSSSSVSVDSANLFRTGNKGDVHLCVDTSVKITNKCIEQGIYSEISDDRLYSIRTNNVTKWKLNIKTVGVSNSGIINIPASDNGETQSTYIEAEVTNPGGNDENFTEEAVNYQWRLEIPEINKVFSNSSQIKDSTFPEGDGDEEGYQGDLLIYGWTLPEVNRNYTGILHVECDNSRAGGEHLVAERVVECKIHIETGGYKVSINPNGERILLVQQSGATMHLDAILYKQWEEHEPGTYNWTVCWADDGTSVNGLSIPQVKSSEFSVDKEDIPQIIEQIGQTNERIALVQVMWTSEDKRYKAISDPLEIRIVNKCN